jgi:4-amino-4-deoxy-L-arabinose transferase-like glycosyltransferase
MVLIRVSNALEKIARSRSAGYFLFIASFATRWLGFLIGGRRADEDGAYLTMAQNYLNGPGISFHFDSFGWTYSWLPPGMSMLQIVFLSFFKNIDLPLRIFFVGLSSLAIVALFALAKRLYDHSYAFLAAFALIFYPPQWFWGSRINPHTYAMDVSIICIYLVFLAWEKRSLVLPIAAGLLWASITLMRAEFALGIGVFAVTSCLAFQKFKDGLLCGLLLLVGFASGMAPWVARNYRLHHAFVLVSTNYGDNVWKAYNPAYQFKGEDIPFPPELVSRLTAEKNEVSRAKILTDEAKEYIKAHPERFVRIVAGNFVNFWRPWISSKVASRSEQIVYSVFYFPIFLMFIWGLICVPWKNPYWLTIVGILFYKNMINLPFYVIVLFREVMLPMIIVIAVLPLARNRIMDKR